MGITGPALRLRCYVGEAHAEHGRPRYQAIVELLRSHGVAGVTVLRGIEGYAAGGVLHTTRVLRLSEDLPVVVEVVDEEARLRPLLPELRAHLGRGGLLTLEPVEAYGPAEG